MIGVPTLAQVRAWVQVPATAISDADLQQILDAELAIQLRTCRVPDDPDPGPVVLTQDGMDVLVTLAGATPGTLYRIAWGDTFSDEVTVAEDGTGTAAHTYADEGEFVVVAYNDRANVVAYYPLTVPGTGTTAPQSTYPAALARACLRRCQREIAVRALPLGAFGTETAEYGPVNLPAWDAEISRLEATYRIPVIA